MYRRTIAIGFAFLATTFVVHVDCQDANAQRLLRRIQSRIQSRLPVLPPVDAPVPPPQSARPAVAPQGSVRPITNDPSKAAQPRRVQPISPAQRSESPAQRSGSPAQRSESPAQRSESSAAKNADSDSASAKKFGGSILEPIEAQDERPRFAAEQPEENTSPDGPSLGIEVYESRRGIPGVEVVRFREESLADEAGLKTGDVIVAIDGTMTPTISAVSDEMATKQFDQQVQARVLRGTTAMNITIPLVGKRSVAAKPELTATNRLRLGFEIDDIRGLRGVVVTEVEANTPAAEAGIEAGDRIVSLDGALVLNSELLLQEVAKRSADEELSLRLVRDGSLVETDVRLTDSDPQALAAAAEKRTDATSAGSPSTLQGIGSALGGFFGGGKATTENGSKPADEMALEDDEPIRQVGFDEEIEIVNPFAQPGKAEPQDRLADDPPSLDVLELPPGNAEPIGTLSPEQRAAQELAEQLRKEISQLEERLKKLEKEKNADQ